MSSISQDVRYAFRQLRRSPGYAITVVITLALAAGASSAMIGVLRATLLHPLPYADPATLLTVSDHNTRGFKDNGLVSVLRVEDLAHARAEGHALFSSVGFFYSDDSTLAVSGAQPIRVAAAAVSGTFFPTLGAPALLGQTLGQSDDIPNGPQRLVISYRLWKNTFAADSAIVGRTVRFGPVLATVVGVMPPSFNLPGGVDLWHPGHIFPQYFGSYRGDGTRFVQVLARLAPNQTLSSAKTGTKALDQSLAARYPATDAGWRFVVKDLRDDLFGEYRSTLILLGVAIALVLFAAALNIAGLQLSRQSTRSSEFSIRKALGITQAQFVRLLVTEGVLLLLLGTLAGLAFAPVLLRLISANLPPALLQLYTPHLDVPVFAVSMSVQLLVGALTAIIPALRSTRITFKGRAGLVGGHGAEAVSTKLGSGLVVAQIALCLMLLTASAAVLTRLYQLLSLPLGFQPKALVTFTVDLPWGFDVEKGRHLYLQAEDRFRALPGVEDAGAITALPLAPYSFRNAFDIVGQGKTEHNDSAVAEGRQISPGYLLAMGIPLLAGRSFTVHDTDPGAPAVLLVNQAFARAYFPARAAVGQQLTNPGGTREIVGVVGDTQGTGGSFSTGVRPELFYPETGGWPHMQFALRSSLAPTALENSIRGIVSSLEPAASPGHFATFQSKLDNALQTPRLSAGLLTAFASLSLLLVVVGIYGLVAFQVAQRKRELGLRIALGSTRAGILSLLLGRSCKLLATGLIAGIGGSVLTAHLLGYVVPQPTSADLFLWLTPGTLLIAGAVLVSTALPAHRGAQVDPNQALKAL